MRISVDLDLSGAVKLTSALAKQIPFAMAKTLTQTAIQAQSDIVQAMIEPSIVRPLTDGLNSNLREAPAAALCDLQQDAGAKLAQSH